MKRLSEWTAEELAFAMEEEVKTLIELEIAFAGIEPVEPPQAPTLADVGIVQSEIAWQVGDDYYHGLLFDNEADARAVAQMNLVKDHYEWANGRNDYHWLEPFRAVVSQKAFYKHADVMRVGKIISENHEQKDPYEKAKTAFEKYLRATSEIRTRVWQAVHRAREHQGEVELAKKTLARYEELTGSRETAEKLLCDAYKTKRDILWVVLDKVPPAEET